MSNYDIIVLGSGPGGYVTAIRASQLGFKTAVVEKESLGGVCLNWGCIPTKALLKSAQVFEYLNHAEDYGLNADNINHDFKKVIERSRNVASGMSKGVNFLMKKNKIDILKGFGKIKKDKVVSVDGTDYSAKHIIIATGAKSRVLPSIPQDGNKIIGYREAMTLEKQPKSITIVGSGAIGIEFAYFYNSIGSDVTVIEYMPNIVPLEDVDVSKELEKSFKKKGIKIMTSSEVISVEKKKNKVLASVKSKGKLEIIESEILLSAVGIKSNIENIGLEDVGIATDIGGGTSFSILETLNEAYKVIQMRGETLSPFTSFYLATLGGAETLALADTIGNFEIGKEADFIILDKAGTPLMDFRMKQTTNLFEELFVFSMLGDDRTIRQTWSMGQLVHER